MIESDENEIICLKGFKFSFADSLPGLKQKALISEGFLHLRSSTAICQF